MSALAPPKIPVLVLTGFLGAGKTTLLNRLLADLLPGRASERLHSQNAQPRIRRIALIENEFASAFGVVENELLPSHPHDTVRNLVGLEELYEFGFGCVCCSTSGELRRVLGEIARKQGFEVAVEDKFAAYNADVSMSPSAFEAAIGGAPAAQEPAKRLDLVILETTGLADPGPVSDVVTMDPTLSPAFEMLGVVGIIDADRVFRELESKKGLQASEEFESAYKNEPLAQLLGSDVIIFSKIDLVPTPTARAALESYISRHRPDFTSSNIFYAIRGQGAPDLDTLVDLLKAGQNGDKIRTSDPRPHDPEVTHVPLIAAEDVVLDADKVAEGFGVFEKAHPGVILRVKGVIRTKSAGDRKLLIHGVADSPISFELGRNWDDGEDSMKQSTVTIIGRGVGRMRGELQRILDGAREE